VLDFEVFAETVQCGSFMSICDIVVWRVGGVVFVADGKRERGSVGDF
jgi:hypothetical protein